MLRYMEWDQLPQTDRQAYQHIRDWIHSTTGMHYPEKKTNVLLQRLVHVCNRNQLNSFSELVLEIQKATGHDLRLAVLHAASTNHTFFYREQKILDFFMDNVPKAFPNEKLRIWSAASSTGEEAYSLAIMLSERFGVNVKNKAAILGTDISASVIEHAEKGVYDGQRLEHVPRTLLPKYFSYGGMNQFRVHDGIKELCTFRRLNLQASPFPFRSKFHTVFCRNVLYYFEKPDQRKVVEALYDVTETGGYLLTSVTESVRELNTRWVYLEAGIYQKV